MNNNIRSSAIALILDSADRLDMDMTDSPILLDKMIRYLKVSADDCCIEFLETRPSLDKEEEQPQLSGFNELIKNNGE